MSRKREGVLAVAIVTDVCRQAVKVRLGGVGMSGRVCLSKCSLHLDRSATTLASKRSSWEWPYCYTISRFVKDKVLGVGGG